MACFAESIARLEGLEWCGYLSTTGVYGDHQGGWVDEATDVRPNLGRGARRVAAEQAWLIMHERYGLPVHIFRLAGIYGPGRGILEQVRAGRARRIVKPGQVFSRIHVDDIAATLRASMRQPNPGAIYNVCDDVPESPARVVEFACRLLGVIVPPPVAFEDAGVIRDGSELLRRQQEGLQQEDQGGARYPPSPSLLPGRPGGARLGFEFVECPSQELQVAFARQSVIAVLDQVDPDIVLSSTARQGRERPTSRPPHPACRGAISPALQA